MTVNTANRKDIREAEKRVRQLELERAETLVTLMSTLGGRSWVWAQLESAGVFNSTYNDNPQRMAFLEGIRSSGLALLNDVMQWCPDNFIQAMREQNERSINNRNNGNATGGSPDDPGEPDTGERHVGEEPRRVAEGRTEPTVADDGEVHYN